MPLNKNRPNVQAQQIEQTEFACGPPFADEFHPPSIDNIDHYKNNRKLPVVQEDKHRIGNSYHKVELNFLFSGHTK